jgi:hypothetical protein
MRLLRYETSKGVVISPDRECPKMSFEKITFNGIVDGPAL